VLFVFDCFSQWNAPRRNGALYRLATVASLRAVALPRSQAAK
jgi:hypothetical protein